jgi:Sec-independent protein translocase protein TatA
MNIFGVGGWEILFIFIIMLIVAGPKRMLEWAYIAGRYTSKLREMWAKMMDTIQHELDDAGVDMKMPKDLSRDSFKRMADEAMRPISDEYRKASEDYEREVKQLDATVRGVNNTNPSINGKENQPTPTEGKDDTGFGTWSGKQDDS